MDWWGNTDGNEIKGLNAGQGCLAYYVLIVNKGEYNEIIL